MVSQSEFLPKWHKQEGMINRTACRSMCIRRIPIPIGYLPARLTKFFARR